MSSKYKDPLGFPISKKQHEEYRKKALIRNQAGDAYKRSELEKKAKDKIKNTLHDDGSKSLSEKRKNIKKKNTESTADVGRVYSPTIPSQNGSSAVSSSNKNLTIFSGKTYSPNSTVRKPNKIEV